MLEDYDAHYDAMDDALNAARGVIVALVISAGLMLALGLIAWAVL